MIEYRLNNKLAKGPITKENALTVYVKTPDGNIIKRHKIKYNVTKIKSLKT